MAASSTLLLVDPLPIFRELESVHLAPIGRIETAADEEAALAILRRQSIQLVIAHFPPLDADTVSLCETIKRSPTLSHIPVILVTSGDRPEQHAAAVRAGADDVLTKPLERVSLLAAVRRLLDGPKVRGLPRVPVDTPVRLAHEGVETWGVARNLSRGGIYLEADRAFPPRTEIRLEFPLPGRQRVLAPVASVVWVQRPVESGPHGMGLRFLGLDGASARSLEHFVRENRGAPAPSYVEGSQ
jgi:uncharacterized protein (TIGR02266 family)